jgi:hypothetical protein
MKLSTLVDVLSAATMSHAVDSPFEQPGGIFLVAPPGQLKTAILKQIEALPDTRAFSDMNTRDLLRVRDEIAARAVRAILFYDWQKIFERRVETAQNICGNVRALIDEGFTYDGEGTGNHQPVANAFALMAMTPACFRRNEDEWISNGFLRRVVVCAYRLEKPEMISEAIIQNIPMRFGVERFPIPIGKAVPQSVTEEESRWLLHSALRYQHSRQATGLTLMRKVWSMLRWRYRKQKVTDVSYEVMKDFAPSLGKKAVDLEIDI